MNRRDFILRAGVGAASGVIPVRFYENCVEWLNNHDRPLLVAPPQPKFEIHALCDGGSEIQLHYGLPDRDVPAITWRKFLEDYHGVDPGEMSEDELETEYDCPAGSLDEECPEEIYVDSWEISDSSNAMAFHYLEGLDLAPGFVRDGRSVGSLDFIQGPCPGSNYTGVHAADEISLSCLQERLNQLGEQVKIVLSDS